MLRKINKPREIIDRNAMRLSLAGISQQSISDKEKRARLLRVLKKAMDRGRNRVRWRLEGGHSTGSDTVAETRYLMDQLIRVLFDYASDQIWKRGVPTKAEKTSVIAVGGYGRGDLAPLSDIDLLFLLPYKRTPFTEKLIEYILYILWDIGLEVGHSVRSINENISQAKQDMTIRTALLESRWVWGDPVITDEFQKRFRQEIVEGTGMEFVKAKLKERDARHERFGDSRYVLEPNIKEDKGGLRDLHTLYWISKYLYNISDARVLADSGVIHQNAASKFEKAQEFLWTVRCHIHYLSGRPDNRLTFDLQSQIASAMGYTDHTGATAVERFMKHYFLIAKDIGDLTRIFCAVLEENEKRKPIFSLGSRLRRKKLEGFVVDGGRLSVTDDAAFEKDPIKLISIFRTALEHGLDLHPNALELATRNARRVVQLRSDKEANQIFMDVLSAEEGPEFALRLMNEAGIFGRFIPDFGRVVAQMQYDMYHVYTTDEHTIRAIGILHKIERGTLKADLPVASEVVKKVQSRRALYVAVMLHDIAKGRGGDHSQIGANIALSLCPRLGLTLEETETVSWLVLHHLLMSDTAFKRDLDDPTSIIGFCELVQSPERLKLLLVLTCADIRAVGPNVWNDWKATLLRELYLRADEHMTGGHKAGSLDHRVEIAREALRKRLLDWTEPVRENFVTAGSPAYWVSFDSDAHESHARFIRAAEDANQKVAVDFKILSAGDVTEMLVYIQDHPGLFATIAGALAVSWVSIVDAKILTLSNGMALDTFYIQDRDGRAITGDTKLRRIKSRLIAALEGRLRLDHELAETHLPRRAKALEAPPRVIIDNTASKVFSVIEINGHDRPGFLSDVTKAITDLGLQISSAHISTYGERVVDVFYVKDIFGMKVEHNTKIKQIRVALGDAIGVAADDVAVLLAARSLATPAAAE